MKKQLLFLALFVVAGSMAPAALADDYWRNHWEAHHDQRWGWNQFRDAHHQYYKLHREERRMRDAELRAQFDRMSGDRGWVGYDDMRRYRHW